LIDKDGLEEVPDVSPDVVEEEKQESPDAKLLDDFDIPSMIGSLQPNDFDDVGKALTEKGGANGELIEM
jgi:hypothetical protein